MIRKGSQPTQTQLYGGQSITMLIEGMYHRLDPGIGGYIESSSTKLTDVLVVELILWHHF
jgi:hypothetical protein